jgi:hypothetical protein
MYPHLNNKKKITVMLIACIHLCFSDNIQESLCIVFRKNKRLEGNNHILVKKMGLRARENWVLFLSPTFRRVCICPKVDGKYKE